MGRKSLVSVVVDGLLDRIIAGELPEGNGLPSEAEIGEAYSVSRMTVREAIKTLQAQGVLRVENGVGTFANPVSDWTSLPSVLRALTVGNSDTEVAIQLIEVRRLFETGAAALAAERHSPADIENLETYLAEMRAAQKVNDVDAFVAADLAFHNVILHASRNVFLGAMFEPLTRVLAERRRETSKVPEIQVHAIGEHQGVLTAIRTGDAEVARRAMNSHMDQTLNDLKTFVL